MLSEDPAQRPNIYQVIKHVAGIRGHDVPLRDVSFSIMSEMLYLPCNIAEVC